MGCKIKNLVSRSYPTLNEGASVAEAARIMSSRNAGSVMVTRDERVVGIFSERDLLKRVVAAGRDPDALQLGDVCTYDLISISHDSSCRTAVQTMQTNRCRRLLVYRGDQFIGIVKLKDLAHAMAERTSTSDLLVNTIGAVTAALAVGVIAMLLLQLPDVFQMAGIVSY
jgi:signal-transduction protein with cAMP-binding, CBS, and nucleotidyltransferase domain